MFTCLYVALTLYSSTAIKGNHKAGETIRNKLQACMLNLEAIRGEAPLPMFEDRFQDIKAFVEKFAKQTVAASQTAS